MFAEFFHAREGLMIWPLVGLFLFLGAFLAVLWWIFFRSRASELDRIASLPLLDDDEPGGARSEGGRS